jgi:glycosyltransferase involved in cell wall biosynthesis
VTNDGMATIVVPYWDLGRTLLDDALNSILHSHWNGSVIVVDNASSPPIVQLPEGVDVVRSANRLSVGGARNLGLSRVKTPYVMFLDADDLLDIDGCRALIVALLESPSAVLVFGRMKGWSPETDVCWLWGFPSERARWLMRKLPSLARRYNALSNIVPTVDCALIRTDAARAAGGFGNTNRGEDWELGAMLSLSGSICLVDDIVATVRVRRDSLTTIEGEGFRSIWRARCRVRRRIRQSSASAAQMLETHLLTALAWPIHLVSAIRFAKYRHAAQIDRIE